MAPKFKLRLRSGKPTRIRNKAGAEIDRKLTDKRNHEIEEAVKYCKENSCSGYTALKTNLFPNIKDRSTIDNRLKGKVKHGQERDYCRILTVDEENTIVEHIKNKNRCCQPMNRKQVTKLVLDVLKIRQHVNKQLGYRRCTILSPNAKNVLVSGKLGRRFWTRFNAAHKDLSIKRKGNISVNRALNCTLQMAQKHIDGLAQELISAGIFTGESKEKAGVWSGEIDVSRIYNHDETPQFIQYGVDGTPSGLYYAGRGETCQNLVKENRECVTIQPFVSFNGDLAMCQVIFSGKSITSNMAPDGVCEKIPNLLISTTENGVQNAKSLLEAYKVFDKYLTEKEIQRPVVLISDGHSSRFDYDVLQFLYSAQILLFLSPPDTTGLLQLLDQINQMLHKSYKECKDDMFNMLSTINREGFMLILAELWGKWTSQQNIINAAKKVGVTPTALSVNFMQKEKFEKAEKIFQSNDADEVQLPLTFSPVDQRKGTTSYYKEKATRLEKELTRVKGGGIEIDKIPGLLSMTKVKKPKLSGEKIRVTQVYGSMEGQKVREKVLEIKSKKEDEAKKKEEKEKLKQSGKDAFIRCKAGCVCNEKVCAAVGFKQCPKCKNVLKSVCSKVVCKDETGRNPKMILPAAALGPPPKRRKLSKKLFVEDITEEETDEYEEEEESDEDLLMEMSDEVEDVDTENWDDKIVEKATDKKDDGKFKIDEDQIGMYYAVKWEKPRKYYWGKLEKVFADDVHDDVTTAEFKFLQPKVLSAYPENVRYDWPASMEVEIVNISQCFYGPTKPEVEHSLFRFLCETEVSNLFKKKY